MVAILSYHYRDFRQERILAMNMKEAFKFLRKKVNRKLRKRRQTEEEDSHSQVLSPVRQSIISPSSCQMYHFWNLPSSGKNVMKYFCLISRLFVVKEWSARLFLQAFISTYIDSSHHKTFSFWHLKYLSVFQSNVWIISLYGQRDSALSHEQNNLCKFVVKCIKYFLI